jgi:hypothetical protein
VLLRDLLVGAVKRFELTPDSRGRIWSRVAGRLSADTG